MNGGFRAVALLGLALVWALAAMPASASESPIQVSLGDSYSSGEGTGDYDRETWALLGNGCHRSHYAWPRLLGVEEDAHLACSGATTKDFFFAQKGAGKDRAPQLDRLKDLVDEKPVSRVYVTIGGNDLGFARIVKRCLWPRALPDCLQRMDQVELPRLRGVVLPDVVRALTAVREAAGGAEVRFVGYPDALPLARVAIHRLECHTWLGRLEQARIFEIETKLDSTLVTAARAAGVEYLSIRRALTGHGMCSDEPWINPVISRFNYKEIGHPNEEGQRQIKTAVAGESGKAVTYPPPPAPSPRCAPAEEVAVIVDDSRSMRRSDPRGLRQEAIKRLLGEPGAQTVVAGATEFGSDAGPLFAPVLVGAGREEMLSSLVTIDGDGFEDGADADHRAGIEASAKDQPEAEARILISDGRTDEPFPVAALRGGPPTYVIGVGAGPGGEGDLGAEFLLRVASETGGIYFPLKRGATDGASAQGDRLPAVVASVGALLTCG